MQYVVLYNFVLASTNRRGRDPISATNAYKCSQLVPNGTSSLTATIAAHDHERLYAPMQCTRYIKKYPEGESGCSMLFEFGHETVKQLLLFLLIHLIHGT